MQDEVWNGTTAGMGAHMCNVEAHGTTWDHGSSGGKCMWSMQLIMKNWSHIQNNSSSAIFINDVN